MTSRVASLVAVATLQLIALVLAHELTFLARYGSRFGEALAHAGHGASWSSAVSTSFVLGALLAGIAVARLLQIGRRVRRVEREFRMGSARRAEVAPRLGPIARAALSAGGRTAFLTAALLTIQENVEHGSFGLGMPGAAILVTPEYAGGLWIALGVGFVVGVVAGLFRWRHTSLLARIRAARASTVRREGNAASRPREVSLAPVSSILGRRSALRAPPLVVSI